MKKYFTLNNRIDQFLIGTIVLLVLLRVVILPVSPPPLAIDEAASGAHIASMITYGTDGNGQTWPLFSTSLGGGYTTPVYLYPAVTWAFVFGYGELSLRAFSEFMTLAAIALIAYGVFLWTDRRIGLVAACVGLALPWGWLQGSLAWDPALVPFFVASAFVAFSSLTLKRSSKTRAAMFVILPTSLVLLAYLYPPLRVSAPLLFVGSYVFLVRKKIVDWKTMILTIIGSTIVSLPLLLFIDSPGSLGRSQNLLVFGHYPFLEAIGAFFVNILLLINPAFFFINGDYNLRHSTGFQGMLGIAALPAFIAIVIAIIRIIKKESRDLLLACIALFGMFAAIIGSALTFEGQPHSLRAIAAWPFIVILLALGWRFILAQENKRLIYTSVAIFFVATFAYATDLALFYPERSHDSFDNTIYEQATHHQQVSYPALDLRYYDLLK